ncbi:helix-turn-helix domain-containing protein [Streptomyces bambusae]|uniref:helix-turn-helix domain-containing protein n=1 Tax=Streptomyces bambusae TaxID=1550616 RepID=UPI001CFD1309|nr:helix-turn-helix transcriptional regulator [Streptomyces bambusae]MCB5165841.1 helix-turn-helix domain-containing protein [Streptomyces bambusae]
MTIQSAQEAKAWGEFGRHLRSWRRQAGLTQQQLGLRVGYHHSLISRLEAGLREPPVGLVRRLDTTLEAGGELAAIAAAPRKVPYGPAPAPADPRLFGALPGGGTAGGTDGGTGGKDALDPLLWPAALPAEGLPCPLHGTAGCAVPERAEVASLLGGLTTAGSRLTGPAYPEAELLHGLTAALACLIRDALHRDATDGVGTVEGLLRAVVRWAEEVNAAGRLPYGQLRLAAQYAQVAGRLRMQRGQSSIGMAWFGHGLGWADAVRDASARATLLSDMCTLVRLDEDAAATVGYAEAIGAVDPRRHWVATLSHLYQARGHALGQDAAECRRQIVLARRRFARLGTRDLLEAPWLAGAEGEMRLESAVGGALRDLAAVTGDRATALRAVDATARSRARLPPLMRGTQLLLTLRLADCWACAGDPGAAVALAAPVLGAAARSREQMVSTELRGLHARLFPAWGAVPEVREYRSRLLDARF